MSAESDSADVFDFVDLYLQSIEHGDDQPLAYWLERFPRSQPAIAREWLSLTSPPGSIADEEQTGAAPSDGVLRLGPYRVLHELGRGGQGTVYLAEDSRIARRVALKVLSTSFDSVSDEKRQRFRREADVIAKLEHPGLCTIHDADLAAQTPWIAMRYVEGKTLADLISDARAAGGKSVFGLRFPPRNTLELHAILLLFERSARALHAAHEGGVVHRDVKPGNVLVALDGRPVLLDFGLARDDDSMIGTITQTGDIFGTPAYMSPEQLEMKSGALDRRTDVYSLGVALFEALTLTRPFDHVARTELYRQILQDPVPDARKRNTALPADVQVVLETALEKERDRRYPTALELAEDLRRIREYEPIHARPASVRVRFARWTRRHPALAVATIGTILALSIGLAITLKLLANERRANSYAVGRHLAQRADAQSAEDSPVALALGIEAVERAPNDLTRASLLTAMEACWLARAIEPHDGDKLQVKAIAASGASNVGVIGFSDGTIALIDVQTGVRRRRLDGHAAGIVSLEFDASGKRLLSADEAGVVLVRDISTGEFVGEFRTDTSCVKAGFGGDGEAVLIQFKSGRIDLFDLASASSRATLAVEHGEGASADFSPDGTLVLVHASPHDPVLFDARSGGRVRTLVCEDKAAACAFVPRDKTGRVLVARADGTISMFDARSGSPSGATARIEGTPTSVVACSDGIHAVVLANVDDAGWAWWCDLSNGRVRRIEEHDDHFVAQAAFSFDGTRFATTSFDTSIRIFETASGRQVRSFRVPLRLHDVVWSADGNRLLTRGRTAFAHLWYARARPDVFDLVGHTAGVTSACFSAEGDRVLTGSEDGTARLWSTPIDGDGHDSGTSVAVLRHDGPVLLARFTAEGRVALTAGVSEAGTFDARDGTPLRPRTAHPARITGAAIDLRGERFVTLCEDGFARIWATRGDSPALLLEGASELLTSAGFSDDGSVVAVAGAASTIRVHDPLDGRLLRRLEITTQKEPATGVIDLAFRPGSREIGVACGDKYLRFFDTASGAVTRWFEEGGKTRDGLFAFQFKSLTFSRDGAKVLVTSRFGGGAARSIAFERAAPRDGHAIEKASSTIPQQRHSQDMTSACYDGRAAVVLSTAKDGSAYVWDATDGSPVARREGFPSAVTCGALSSAGGTLRAITGCADGSVCVWPVDPLPAARARLPRALASWEKERERQLALPLVLEFDE